MLSRQLSAQAVENFSSFWKKSVHPPSPLSDLLCVSHEYKGVKIDHTKAA